MVSSKSRLFNKSLVFGVFIVSPLALIGEEQCPFVVGESFSYISKSEIKKFLNEYPAEKSQFETTEKFQNRQKAHVEKYMPSTSIVATEMDKRSIKYDADNEVFYYTKWLFSNGRYGPKNDLIADTLGVEDWLDKGNLQGITQRIYDEEQITGGFRASNSMGASIDVVEKTYVNATIVGQHVVDKDTMEIKKDKWVLRYYGLGPVEFLESDVSLSEKPGPVHFLPYGAEKAEQFYNGLKTFTAFVVQPPYVLVDSYIYEATFDLPEERYIQNFAIKADILCSAIVDADNNVAQILTPIDGYLEYSYPL